MNRYLIQVIDEQIIALKTTYVVSQRAVSRQIIDDTRQIIDEPIEMI